MSASSRGRGAAGFGCRETTRAGCRGLGPHTRGERSDAHKRREAPRRQPSPSRTRTPPPTHRSPAPAFARAASDLYEQQLPGDISSVDLAPLGALQRLNLAQTPLRGTLPAAWARAAALRLVDVNSAQWISGTLPAAWAAMRQLDTLSVARCSLAGSLPPEWGRGMARIRRLDASDNVGMGGPLPPEWGRLRTLKLL